MSAFHFKELSVQPALGDSIELRDPGTSTPITGQITDVSGGNLSNPFLVSAAGVEGDWAFVAPDDIHYDVYWVEGNDVIGKDQIEVSGGGSGGSSEWEFLLPKTVTVTPVQEITFGVGGDDPLDFSTYDYLITGKLVRAGVSPGHFHWYAQEANAASVVPGGYSQNRAYLQVNVNDSQASANHLFGLITSPDNEIELGQAVFSEKGNGNITMSRSDGCQQPASLAAPVILDTVCNVSSLTSTATKISLYTPTANVEFGVGTRLYLSRRAKV